MIQKNFSFQNTDIREIDPAELADRQNIRIDSSLPQKERLREYIRQTNGHPDCVIIDGVVVLSRFADTDTTMEELLMAAVRNA